MNEQLTDPEIVWLKRFIAFSVGESKKIEHVPDLKPEEIVKPSSPFDEPSDDEILYYATSYWDELQEKKEEKNKILKDQIIE